MNGVGRTGGAGHGSARPDGEPVPTASPPPRRTKIVATLGPSTDGRVGELIEAGLDCARLNCSHGSAEELRSRCVELRAAARTAGRSVAVMFDLQGPKIRLDGSVAERELCAGEEVVLTVPGKETGEPTSLCVAYAQLPALVSERSEVVIGDGAPRLRVTGIEGARIRALTVIGGRVSARKGVNVTHAQPKLPAITDKDRADARVAVECEADFVALSFVRCAEDVFALRELLADLGSEARVVAKIEKVEALEHLESIVQAADAVMVARGDYGVEAGIPQVPAMQKDTIRCAGRYGKLVITATQMLESMISCPLPTRAEAADVFNAIVDGTSAVMLSAETGVGAYPLEAVRTMADIALCAEQQEIYCEPRTVRPRADEAVMRAAVALARDTNAAALVVPSSRGGTVRACARYRPRRPIYALCDNERVARQLNLEWGVYPSIFEHPSKAPQVAQARAARRDRALRPAAGHAGGHHGRPTHRHERGHESHHSAPRRVATRRCKHEIAAVKGPFRYRHERLQLERDLGRRPRLAHRAQQQLSLARAPPRHAYAHRADPRRRTQPPPRPQAIEERAPQTAILASRLGRPAEGLRGAFRAPDPGVRRVRISGQGGWLWRLCLRRGVRHPLAVTGRRLFGKFADECLRGVGDRSWGACGRPGQRRLASSAADGLRTGRSAVAPSHETPPISQGALRPSQSIVARSGTGPEGVTGCAGLASRVSRVRILLRASAARAGRSVTDRRRSAGRR